MLKGLIFDLDGVITDSAVYHLRAWNQLASEIGIKLPPAASDDLRGRSRMDSLQVILRYGNQVGKYSDDELAEFAERKNTAYRQSIKAMTRDDVLPGMLQLLQQARQQGLKMAIASASKNAPTILHNLQLESFFPEIVDPDSLQHGKPDPEIYVAAQQLLGLSADEVISFEDAAAGVTAIKAAHQFAVGIGDAQVLRHADYIVKTTAQLHLDQVEAAFNQQLQGLS